MNSLNHEFKWFLKNRDDLIRRYEGHFLVIKNQEILGVYDDDMDAIRHTISDHELGTFLVQKCTSDPYSITAKFHSWVRV